MNSKNYKVNESIVKNIHDSLSAYEECQIISYMCEDSSLTFIDALLSVLNLREPRDV